MRVFRLHLLLTHHRNNYHEPDGSRAASERQAGSHWRLASRTRSSRRVHQGARTRGCGPTGGSRLPRLSTSPLLCSEQADTPHEISPAWIGPEIVEHWQGQFNQPKNPLIVCLVQPMECG